MRRLALALVAGMLIVPAGAWVPSEWGREDFYPRVPQFAVASPRKPEWQLFWIVKHGVRYSGMGAWRHLMPDSTIWQVVGFLSRLDSLPPAVEAAWRGRTARA